MKLQTLETCQSLSILLLPYKERAPVLQSSVIIHKTLFPLLLKKPQIALLISMENFVIVFVKNPWNSS